MTPADLPLPAPTIARHLAPGAAHTVWVIHNPTAGSGLMKKRVELDGVRQHFLERGWNVASVVTRHAGDGTDLAKLAIAEGADVVVAMGGDGTVNEVVQALVGTEVPLGIIPLGTVNVLARELGLPDDPLAAVDILAADRRRAIDVGRANGRYFTMMVGLGYDAAVTNQMMPGLKQVSGTVAYWVAGVQTFMKHKAVRARLRVEDGRRSRSFRRLIYMMVISNTGLYAGGLLKFSPDASITDGLLDVCMIRSRTWYQAAYHVVLPFLDRLKGADRVDFFQARRIVLRTARPFPYHLDGDPAGTTPLTIEIVPAGLWVLVPEAPAG